MKTLKLLNRKYLSILLIVFLLSANSKAEDNPVDIWNIDKDKIETTKSDDNQNNNEVLISEENTQSSVYDMQAQKQIDTVQVESSIDSQDVKIIGLYDPEDYDLKMDMWSYSNGDQIKSLFSNLLKLDLSQDALDIMNLVLLTNAYYPEDSITEKEFLKIKSDWLIKNMDRDLIEEYLTKNQILNLHPKLSRYFIDQYLSEANIEKACEIFLKNSKVIEDEY